MLIEVKIKLDSRTESGETALDLAINNGHKECARLLILHGCDVNIKVYFTILSLLLID